MGREEGETGIKIYSRKCECNEEIAVQLQQVFETENRIPAWMMER